MKEMKNRNGVGQPSSVEVFAKRCKRDLFFRISMLLCLVALFLLVLWPESWGLYVALFVLAMSVIATVRLLRKGDVADDKPAPAWVAAMDIADKFMGAIWLVLAVVIIVMKSGILQ